MNATLKLDGPSLDEQLGLVERHTLIVGASRGLGEEVARLLGSMPGARLSLAARSYNKLVGLTVELGHDRCVALTMDVGNEDSIVDGVQRAIDSFGPPQSLVITAGTHKATPVADNSAAARARFESVLRVNLMGPWWVAQQVANVMAPGGSIVFVGNARSSRGMATRHAHAAAKMGLVALARGMAAELGQRGIRVNIVEPGIVDTDLGRALLQERAARTGRPFDEVFDRAARTNALRRVTTAHDVAEVVKFLLSPASAGVTGETIEVSSGMSVG